MKLMIIAEENEMGHEEEEEMSQSHGINGRLTVVTTLNMSSGNGL